MWVSGEYRNAETRTHFGYEVPYLFTVYFSNWSKQGAFIKSYSWTTLKFSFQNSHQNSHSTCKTCSAPPYDNSCYRVCKYPKHWQLRSASFCSGFLWWIQIASCLCSVKSKQRQAWLPEAATAGKSTLFHSWAAGPLLPFSATPTWNKVLLHKILNYKLSKVPHTRRSFSLFLIQIYNDKIMIIN